MIGFSPRIFRDRVLICPLVKGQNAGGGKTRGFPAVGDPVACTIAREGDTTKQMGEYEATQTKYRLTFPGPPPRPIRPEDEVARLLPDGAEFGRMAVVSAPTPDPAWGGLWVAYAITVE